MLESCTEADISVVVFQFLLHTGSLFQKTPRRDPIHALASELQMNQSLCRDRYVGSKLRSASFPLEFFKGCLARITPV